MADTTFRNVVNGELVDAASGETYDILDPTTGQVYATAPKSGAEDVDPGLPVGRQRPSRPGATRPRRTARRRCSTSLTPGEALPRVRRRGVKDTGKPIGFTIDEELPPAIDQLRFFAGAARVLEGKSAGEYLKDHTSWVRREPIGVVGQVTPWNYPLMMMVWKIAPALAAGNCLVLKPSDTTPASTAHGNWRPSIESRRVIRAAAQSDTPPRDVRGPASGDSSSSDNTPEQSKRTRGPLEVVDLLCLRQRLVGERNPRSYSPHHARQSAIRNRRNTSPARQPIS